MERGYHNMDPNKTTIILGPPGTGKTTRLLSIVEQELAAGTPPNKIGYLAFTRKAAKEARERAVKNLGLDPDQLPYFRTLHSMATLMQGLRIEAMMQPGHYLELAKLLTIRVTAKRKMEPEAFSLGRKDEEGDRYISLDYLARNTLAGHAQVWEDYNTQNQVGSKGRFDQFCKALHVYKKSRGLLDYTDIIENFVSRKPCPKLSCLVIDEGQDLSALQWEMVKTLSEKADQVYIGGDDEQAIFGWAGADVKHFISLEGQTEVLPVSYRLPARVHKLACRLADNLTSRRPKKWSPRADKGQVDLVWSWEEAGLDSGQWLILARNHYQLAPVIEYCREQGYNYATQAGHLAISPMALAIDGWQKLQAGQAVDLTTAKAVYDYMDHTLLAKGSKVRLAEAPSEETYTMKQLQKDYGLWHRFSGIGYPWYTVLTKVKGYDVDYFKHFLDRGEQLLSEPRIKISTIHGAKGGEADNVLLLTDMSRQTEENYEADPDSETRVFYVGVTRARNRLAIVSPQTSRYFSPLLDLV